MKKRPSAKFSLTPEIENGFYVINLCGGYKLKYNNSAYLLTDGVETFTTSEQEIREWALENCNIAL